MLINYTVDVAIDVEDSVTLQVNLNDTKPWQIAALLAAAQVVRDWPTTDLRFATVYRDAGLFMQERMLGEVSFQVAIATE